MAGTTGCSRAIWMKKLIEMLLILIHLLRCQNFWCIPVTLRNTFFKRQIRKARPSLTLSVLEQSSTFLMCYNLSLSIVREKEWLVAMTTQKLQRRGDDTSRQSKACNKAFVFAVMCNAGLHLACLTKLIILVTLLHLHTLRPCSMASLVDSCMHQANWKQKKMW